MDWDLVRFLAAEAALFIAGAVIGAVSFRAIALPLLYALPRAVVWVARGRLRWGVVDRLLASPLWWAVLFASGAYLLARFAPGAWERLYSSPLFYLGLWAGVSLRAFRALGSKAGQLKLRDDFLDRIRSHVKERAPTEDERLGEDVHARIWHLSRGGTRYGPYTYEELRRRAVRGELRDDDLLWRPGVTGYMEASSVLGPVKKEQST
jgi:hypothetical protein